MVNEGVFCLIAVLVCAFAHPDLKNHAAFIEKNISVSLWKFENQVIRLATKETFTCQKETCFKCAFVECLHYCAIVCCLFVFFCFKKLIFGREKTNEYSFGFFEVGR